ncbi:DNA cytosine methyltransferase [Rhodobacteraceae bacterium]|nr:DNA cytosine methyltransferase [Paracoccaceae bacterium]
MKIKKLKVLSLFSGAGGLDLGFKKSGHEIVWANDFDKDSCETYMKNIGNHIIHGDIAELTVNGLPDFDILIGGFPCQGFSRANVHRVENDERNDLYLHVIRILRKKQPKFFLLENVRGIKTLNAGKDFSEIILALEESGYSIRHKTLNAADFGVPQNRVRVIITGIRQDLTTEFKYEYPDPTHSRNGETADKWVSIAKALHGIGEPDETSNLSNHVCSKYKVTNRDFTGHRRTDPDKPSPTILARGNGGGGVCAIQHPLNHRRLSVRESAIIQTFPLDFIFLGSLMSMYRQVGNAVPALFAEKLAQGFERI